MDPIGVDYVNICQVLPLASSTKLLCCLEFRGRIRQADCGIDKACFLVRGEIVPRIDATIYTS